VVGCVVISVWKGGGDVQEGWKVVLVKMGWKVKYAVCDWFMMLRISVFTLEIFCLWRQIVMEHIIHDVLCFLPLTCSLNVLMDFALCFSFSHRNFNRFLKSGGFGSQKK